MRLRALELASALTLAGCAVGNPNYAPLRPPLGKSVVYVFRPYSFAGVLIDPAVTCGDTTVGIKAGYYHAYVVSPGRVACQAATESRDEVEFDVIPGREYYVKEEIGWGRLIGHPHLHPMDADAVQTEVESCRSQP